MGFSIFQKREAGSLGSPLVEQSLRVYSNRHTNSWYKNMPVTDGFRIFRKGGKTKSVTWVGGR